MKLPDTILVGEFQFTRYGGRQEWTCRDYLLERKKTPEGAKWLVTGIPAGVKSAVLNKEWRDNPERAFRANIARQVDHIERLCASQRAVLERELRKSSGRKDEPIPSELCPPNE